MTTFPNAPRLLKGGLVLIDPGTAAVRRVIALQYNPDMLTRTLQVQAFASDGGADRSEAMRIKGPPVETIKLDAELDATDYLEFPDRNRDATDVGLLPQLAALETILYPTSQQLFANQALSLSGTLEIVPMQAPLTLFIWSEQRILPVRITDMSVTEEAFDPALNPIRAKVSLGMRVLSVNDLGFEHKGGGLFMTYLQAKEQLVSRGPSAALGALGITGIR
jgi:hypothetical protein